MTRYTTRTVFVALSAAVTCAVLLGIGHIADTQSAAYPEMLARAKAREAAGTPVSVAAASTTPRQR